eukprot:scaffold79197_cov32-Phaeocystis_antarctica.AAC.2
MLYPRDAPRGLGVEVLAASALHLVRVRVRVRVSVRGRGRVRPRRTHSLPSSPGALSRSTGATVSSEAMSCFASAETPAQLVSDLSICSGNENAPRRMRPTTSSPSSA